MRMANPPDVTDLDFLTVQEVATLLRVSTRLIYRMVEDGRLKAVRIGNVVRIPKAAMLELAR